MLIFFKDDNYALRFSVEVNLNSCLFLIFLVQGGHEKIVKELMKHKAVDPSVWNNYAMRFCCTSGQHKVLKQLLKDPRVDPSIWENFSIREGKHAPHDLTLSLFSIKRRTPRSRQVAFKRQESGSIRLWERCSSLGK